MEKSFNSIHQYKFTEEDKEDLLFELGGRQHYPPEKVKMFIRHIERYCSAAVEALDKPARTEDRKTKKRMIGRFERAIEELELIANWKIELDYPFVAYMEPEFVENEYGELIPLGGDETLFIPGEDGIFSTTADKAKAALEELVKKIRENLEATSRPRGSRTGADPTGLILALAQIFSIYFGDPTAYDDGPFAEVVRIAHRTVGLPHQDLSRGIKKALSRQR